RRPAYGILVPAGLGHVVDFEARRAPTADNFGPYIDDPSSFHATEQFFETESEEEALRIAHELKARFVVTADFGGDSKPAILYRRQRADGCGLKDGPCLGHFRLVTEGPNGGMAIGTLYGLPLPRPNVRYKLFEIVEGARLELRGAPKAPVSVQAELRTPIGRHAHYAAGGTLGDDGVAIMRVPYPTERSGPVFATGPYQVVIGDRVDRVEVSEAQVRNGDQISIGGAASERSR